MKTYRITEKDIEGMTPVAVGYKMFNHDYASRYGNYDYKDENGNVVGTIHKVDGDISACYQELHFCERPQSCFYYYEPLQWNKFAKVEAYGNLIKNRDKLVTSILKIVRTYTFDEFIKLIKFDYEKDLPYTFNNANINSFGISSSKGIAFSNGLCACLGVSHSNGINSSGGIMNSNGVYIAGGIKKSNAVSNSTEIFYSNGITGSDAVSYSCGICDSHGVINSYGVVNSYGVINSYGIMNSYGIVKCDAMSCSIFCYKESGKFMAFNKKITRERFNEIYSKLKSFRWFPRFNNARELKDKFEWYETNIPAMDWVDAKTAWSFMPQDMMSYIESLPEYNAKIFEKVTNDDE